MNKEILNAIEEKKQILVDSLNDKQEAYSKLENDFDILTKAQLKEMKQLKTDIKKETVELVKIEEDLEEYSKAVKGVNDLESLIKKEKKQLTKEVLQETLELKKTILEEKEAELVDVYNIEFQSEQEELENEEENEEENKIESEEQINENNKPAKNKNIKRIGAAIAALVILLAAIKLASKSNNNSIVNTPRPTTIEDEFNNESPKTIEAYGFVDVSDVNQVIERSEEISKTLEPVLNNMVDDFENKDLSNVIANIIRIGNGELPIDQDGKVTYNPNDIDYYMQLAMDLFGNYASSPQLDKIYQTNWASLTEDGSDLNVFMSRYDDVYNKIADARNNNDSEGFVNSTKDLGKLLYNDWTLQGMYEGKNPYNLKAEQRYLAYLSAVSRYSSYVHESELGGHSPVCVEVCVNYETGQLQSIPVIDIYNAITLGKSNDATLSMYAPDGFQIISQEFYKDLQEELEFKYNNNNVLTLS